MMAQVLPAFYDSFTRGRKDAIDFQNLITAQKQNAQLFPYELESRKGYAGLATQYNRQQTRENDTADMFLSQQRDNIGARYGVEGQQIGNEADYWNAVNEGAAGMDRINIPGYRAAAMNPSAMGDSFLDPKGELYPQQNAVAGGFDSAAMYNYNPDARTGDFPSYLQNGFGPPGMQNPANAGDPVRSSMAAPSMQETIYGVPGNEYAPPGSGQMRAPNGAADYMPRGPATNDAAIAAKQDEIRQQLDMDARAQARSFPVSGRSEVLRQELRALQNQGLGGNYTDIQNAPPPYLAGLQGNADPQLSIVAGQNPEAGIQNEGELGARNMQALIAGGYGGAGDTNARPRMNDGYAIQQMMAAGLDPILAQYALQIDKDLNLEPGTAAALSFHESDKFNPDAVSSAGAVGLGQIMPGNFAKYGGPNFNPVNGQQSLMAMHKLLRERRNAFPDDTTEMLLRRYNGLWNQDYSGAATNPKLAKAKAENDAFTPKVRAAYQKLFNFAPGF